MIGDEYDDLLDSFSTPKGPKNKPVIDYRKLYNDVGTKYGVDPDLLYNQAKHESINFNPNFVYGPGRSPKGAAGIAQFMPDTARQYGLRVQKGQDDRFNPQKAADAHARLMKDLIDRYGDTKLALAAYNSGTNRTPQQARAAMQRIPETRNYVQKIAPQGDQYDQLLDNVGQQPSQQAKGDEYDDLLNSLTTPESATSPKTVGMVPGIGAARQMQQRRVAKPSAWGKGTIGQGIKQPNVSATQAGRERFNLTPQEQGRLQGQSIQRGLQEGLQTRAGQIQPISQAMRQPAITGVEPADDLRARVARQVEAEYASLPGQFSVPLGDPIGAITKSREQMFNEEVERRVAAQQRSQTPEVVSGRKEMGRLPAAARAVEAPQLRAQAGALKAIGGVASLAGIAPNRVSDYLNKKGQYLEDVSTQPLSPTGEAIQQGLLEKLGAALGDLGISVATLVGLKHATGLSLGSIMAIETGLKTSDQPLRDRAPQIAAAYGMGKILDQHLSRPVSAALFGGPTAVQSGLSYAQGNMSLEDALLQTGVQTAAGAILGGKEKSSLSRGLDREIAREASREPIPETRPEVPKVAEQIPAAPQAQAAPEVGAVEPPKPVIRHSDPRIDGGEIIGKTSDGKLKVQNKDGGVSVVQNPRTQGNREATIIKPSVLPEPPPLPEGAPEFVRKATEGAAKARQTQVESAAPEDRIAKLDALKRQIETSRNREELNQFIDSTFDLRKQINDELASTPSSDYETHNRLNREAGKLSELSALANRTIADLANEGTNQAQQGIATTLNRLFTRRAETAKPVGKGEGVAEAAKIALEPPDSVLAQLNFGKEEPIDVQRGVYKTKTARGKEYSFDLHTYKLADGRERLVLSAGDPKELVDAGAIVRPKGNGVVVETIHGGETGFKNLGAVLARQIRKRYGTIIPDVEAPLSPAGRKATEKLALRGQVESATPATPEQPAQAEIAQPIAASSPAEKPPEAAQRTTATTAPIPEAAPAIPKGEAKVEQPETPATRRAARVEKFAKAEKPEELGHPIRELTKSAIPLRDALRERIDLVQPFEKTTGRLKVALEKAGWVKDGELTELGQRMVDAQRAINEGLPIERYEKTSAKAKPINGRYGEGWIAGTFSGGEKGFSNGHFAVVGEPPKGEPIANADKPLNIEQVIPKDATEKVNPIGFSDNEKGTRLIWFEDGAPIDAKYYEALRQRFPKAEWYSNGKESSPLVLKEGKKVVGVVQGIREEVPRGIRTLREQPQGMELPSKPAAEPSTVTAARKPGKTVKGLPREYKLSKSSKTLYELSKGDERVGVIQRVGDQWRVANSDLPRFNTPEEAATAIAKKGEAGAVDVDLLTLGVHPFAKEVAEKGRGAIEGAKQVSDAIKSLVAPATRGPEARTTAAITRANASEMARAHDIAEKSLEGARDYFSKQKPESNYQFIDRMEKGQIQSDPKTQNFANTLRSMLDQRREQIRALGTGKLDNFIENYFPHIWKNPEKARNAFAEAFGRRPMEGSKAFLKQRKIPLTSEGLSYGLEPVSNNPVDLTILKLREMDKYIMAHNVMREMKENGLLKFVKSTERTPEGFKRIDDRVATVYGGPSSRPEGGQLIRGYYVAPEPAAKILNNYLSPGIESTALRVPFKAWRASANLLNQAQLGFSFFHGGFTTLDAMISRTAMGLEDIFRYGKPVEGLKAIASTPVSPITNLVRGSRMLREWYQPGSQGAETAKMVNAMVEGGGRAKMDQIYMNNASQRFMDTLKQGNLIGAALRLPGATIETAMKPVMQWLVPRQKAGIFAEMARRELERLGPDASREQVRTAMAKAWDSVDNRMGQMVYDNIFWNKMTKDLAMASVRSVGWNLGTAREVAGGVADYLTLPKRALQKGRTEPLFTHKMAYATALPIVVGAMGAMTQYLLTGKKPEELKDYFFPKTGLEDENGNPERISFPSYMKDIFHLREEPGKVITSKMHPLISMVAEMLSNKDYYGTEIRNADEPLIQQIKDIAKYGARSVTPFSVRGYQKETERGGTFAKRILPFVGITPAPAYINQSDAEKFISRKLRDMVPSTPRTKEQANKSQLIYQIEQKVRRNEDASGDIEAAQSAGLLTERDVKRIQREGHLSRLEIRIARLPPRVALDAFKLMRADERQKVSQLIGHKAYNLEQANGLTDEDRQLLESSGVEIAKQEKTKKPPTSSVFGEAFKRKKAVFSQP